MHRPLHRDRRWSRAHHIANTHTRRLKKIPTRTVHSCGYVGGEALVKRFDQGKDRVIHSVHKSVHQLPAECRRSSRETEQLHDLTPAVAVSYPNDEGSPAPTADELQRGTIVRAKCLAIRQSRFEKGGPILDRTSERQRVEASHPEDRRTLTGISGTDTGCRT